MATAVTPARLPAESEVAVLPAPAECMAFLYSSYERKVRLMYGSTRVTAAVLPFQKASTPSSLRICGTSDHLHYSGRAHG